MLVVPAATRTATATAAPPAQQPKSVRQQVLDGFSGPIARVTTSSMYRLGILAAAVVMLLLPAIYVALIVLVAYGIYWHAVNDVGMIGAVRGRAVAWVAILYATPIGAGAILLLFMIKPLFARPAQQGRIRSLTRKGEPLLFEFVNRLCEAVGAPRPKQINVDCNVNASASFRRGLLSMFGHDLVLTIGMPLVAGLNLQQFAGVVAHEFGHFTQGFGMRISYLVRSISWWFTRVVYERDQWDERLVEWCQDTDVRISLFLYLARFFIWLTRKILWALMMVGHAVSGFLLRHMEFDADRHEARLVGGDAFEVTSRQITLLSVAYEAAKSDLAAFYRDGRLADNLPKLVTANLDNFPSKLCQEIVDDLEKQTTHPLDTHPSHRDRVASARKETAAPVFRSKLPASALFGHYKDLCRNVTWDFYRGVLGPNVKPDDLHPVEELIRHRAKDRESSGALNRFFQGSFNVLRPLRLPSGYVEPPSDADASLQQLRDERKAILTQQPQYAKQLAAFEQIQDRLVKADQARALAGARVSFKPAVFEIGKANSSSANQSKRQAAEELERLSREMGEFEEPVGRRLYTALQLLQVDGVAAKIEDARQIRELSDRLVRCASAVNRAMPELVELRNCHAALHVLLSVFDGNREQKMYLDELTRQIREMLRLIGLVRESFTGVDYPFDHAKGQISVAAYVAPEPPPDDDLRQIYSTCEAILDGVFNLYHRTCARLTEIAEQVEAAAGLEPLPEPA